MKKTMIRLLVLSLVFPAALFFCACKDREIQTKELENQYKSSKVSETEIESSEQYPNETGPEVPVVLDVAETALIPEHPFLKDTPFFDACLGDAMSEEPVEEYPSKDLGEGTIRFYKGEGITYITQESPNMEPKYRRVRGAIITDPCYSFACGLRPGMGFDEVKTLDLNLREAREDELENNLIYTVSDRYTEYDTVYLARQDVEDYKGDKYNDFYFRFSIFLKDGKVDAVSADMTDGKGTPEFSIRDVFIPEHPVLKEDFFPYVKLDTIRQYYPDLKNIGAHYAVNTTYISYYEADGIVYASLSDSGIDAVLITNDKYSFACGLRPGMDVESVYDCGLKIDEDPDPGFDPAEKDSVTWRNDSMGEIFSELGVEGELNSLTYNFNLFEVNAYRKEKMGESYTPIKGGQTPISVFIKGDKVVAVGTQIPF